MTLKNEIKLLRERLAACSCRTHILNRNPKERFFKFIKKLKNGCWEWQGDTYANGYGRMSIHGKQKYVHRYSYELHKGLIAPFNVIDHLCRNRACVNPDHLESVTYRENIIRGSGESAQALLKTQCKNGHPFDNKNTLYRENGHRRCRICTRKWNTNSARNRKNK